MNQLIVGSKGKPYDQNAAEYSGKEEAMSSITAVCSCSSVSIRAIV
jgi:hypothetical protein